MTTGYLMVDQPNPFTAQGTYPRRGTRGKLTGTCILHTTEGAWTAGVQSLINLVRSRSDYGCYHRACDWQDIALLYPWEWETWQDSETNNWAVGISAACRTSDWAVMPADIREGYYRNMGRMAADFVNYMKTTYGITVPLARLSGDQARAGVPGFCAHGDSGIARSDPGAAFDWTKFFNYTRQALGSAAIAPQSTTTKSGGLTVADINSITKQLNEIKAALAPINTSSGEVDLRQFIADGTRAAQAAEKNTGPINVSGGKQEGIRDFIAKGTRAAQAAEARLAALESVLGKALTDPGADLATLTAAAEAGAAKALSNLSVTIEQGDAA